MHFVPTSSSWLNLIERWFAELTTRRVRRGSFLSVEDLEKAISEFLAAWNEHPQPFVWTATVESIQEKLSRCRQTLEQIQPGCTLPRSRKRQSIAQVITGHYTSSYCALRGLTRRGLDRLPFWVQFPRDASTDRFKRTRREQQIRRCINDGYPFSEVPGKKYFTIYDEKAGRDHRGR